MSDLQCPARFLLLATLDGAGADALRGERIAAVYDEPHAPDAAALADALGVPLRQVRTRPHSAAVTARDVGALEVLRELADLHRGESVVLGLTGSPDERLEVLVDGDGVRVRRGRAGEAAHRPARD